MSNLGMQLELSMTAKGVQATLKDAQGAIVQTAQVVKSQFGPGGSADQGLSKFKENLSRSREAAMFFTASLGEFGPAGRTAQTALAGIAGAIMGGGGVLLALEGAKVVVRLLSEAWGENAAEVEKARAEMQRAAEDSKKRMAELADEIERTRLASLGLSSEQINSAQKMKTSSAEVAVAARTVQQLKEEIADLRANPYIGSENRLPGLQQEVAKWEQALAAASAYRAQLEVLRAMQGEAGRAAQEGIANRNLAGTVKAPAGGAAAAKSDGTGWRAPSVGGYGGDGDGKDLAAIRKAQEVETARALAASEAASKKMAADAKAVADSWLNAGAQMGEAVGSALAGIITGAQSGKEAMAGLLKATVSMVIDSVKATVMAQAASAAAGSAASVAPTPFIGPVLAASAMAAVLAMVQGLVGQIPSAAGGWERVPSDGIAMIHKNEQVWPAEYAEGVRNLIANGGGGGTTINLNVSAMDARSFRKFALDNDGALLSAVARAAREGRRA